MHAFIVKSSELISARRWDAAFHQLAQKHRANVEALRDAIGEQEALIIATELFDALPAHFRQAIAPLVRTQQNVTPGRERLLAALREYPLLSIAIFQSFAEQISQHYDQERMELEARQARVMENVSRTLQAIERRGN